MKRALIIIALALMGLVPALTAHAFPVSMTLTYDGRTRQYNAESIDLRVNGQAVKLELMPPVVLEGRTYVPSREVFEPLGALVDWKESSRELYIGYGNTLVVLKPGADTADVNGELIPLESPAKIINNKLMIPARFVAESLGIPVEWNGDTRTVSIGSSQASDPAPEQSYEQPQTVPQPIPQVPSAVGGVSTDISLSPLTEISGGPVDVTGFSSVGSTFTISASGPFTKADKVLLPENKLVIDMYNATNALPQGSYASGGFSGVAAVRNSQFQVTPVKITRVVFDLSGAARYSVSFSDDRKSIIVKFEDNTVNDISYRPLDDGERITITASLQPTINASRMFSPEKLVLDIPGARLAAGQQEIPVNGRFAQKIRASQFDEQTVRVVIDLNESTQLKITYEGNSAIITLSAPTYKNIGYVQEPQNVITLKGANISASSVTHNDDYLNGKYILTLPGDYSSVFGHGEFEINDSIIGNITIQNNGLSTDIIINEKSIYAYTLAETGGNLEIRPVNPKEVYKTVVYLDAGHGFTDPGAAANGFQEKNLNLNIALRLHEHLEKDPEIKVYASRLEDTYPELLDRAAKANHVADLFVSVHHNSTTNAKSNGTEVLYLNHAGEAYPNISSEAVARIFQTNLVRDIDTTDRGVVRRPELIVLNQTKIPAVIIEVIFLTNKDDINKVSTQEGRQIVADSLYRSIKEIFSQYPTGR